MKVLTFKGYDFWMDSEGYYGVTKEDANQPHCGYAHLWIVLQQKGI